MVLKMASDREDNIGFRKATHLSVETEMEEGILTAKVSGRIDSKRAPEFETALQEIIEGADRAIVVDLGGVTFIGSTGLRTLLNAATVLRERGTAFAVCCPSGPLRGIFRLSGMDRVIPVATSRVDAKRITAS